MRPRSECGIRSGTTQTQELLSFFPYKERNVA